MLDARAVRERYLRLLDGPLGAQTLEWLSTQRGLAAFGAGASTVLMPVFVDSAVHSAALEAAEEVYAALRRAADRLKSDARLRRRYRYPERFDILIEADRHPPAAVLPVRPDGYIDHSGQIRFLEFNTIPGGFAASRQMAELFVESPALRHVDLRAARVTCPSTFEPMRSAIAGLARPDGRPVRIGAVGPRLDWEYPAIIALCRELGAELVSALPDEVTVAGGRARFGEHEVDHVVLGHPSKLGPDFARHPLIASFLRGEPVSLLRGLGDALLLGRKSALALLTDEEFLRELPGGLARAVRAHVPWTRLLADERATGPTGESIALLEHARTGQHECVLKPLDQQGGAGVVRGWTVSSAQWADALQAGLGRPHVIQARVDGREYPLPVLRDGSLHVEQRVVDFCPFLWGDGRARGVFARSAGTSGMTNVHGDGGVVGCLSIG